MNKDLLTVDHLKKKLIIEFVISIISVVLGSLFIALGIKFNGIIFLAALFGSLALLFYGAAMVTLIGGLIEIFW